ncbi:ribonuclease P protein component 4 [Aeropyrum camini]|uniref:Ribonuclease P protein component 4 n=1 Tax=Aeropyrum camini SY1 = JCM 12091 TaxID=1198449 RepID=U3TCN6_9CREN|nr:ribonuclease P protein component 4 [Aeropyrum camini]BAN90176.1 ribonuclease P protein component 4 [Aeropyrum camini SY1 = JCM 12091]
MKRRRRRRCRDSYARLVRGEEERLARWALELARRGLAEEARRVASQLFQLAASTRVRPPRTVKRMFCKSCRTPLVPGLTARVRLRSEGGLSYTVVTCLHCGWIHRYPYRKGPRGGEAISPRTGVYSVGEEYSGEREGEGPQGPPRQGGRDNR